MALQQIGNALDVGHRLRVHNHGLVALDQEAHIIDLEEENRYEGKRKRRPAAGSRKRAARWKRPSNRSRQAGAATRVCSGDLNVAYKEQIARLAEAYPKLKTFSQDDGIWLLAQSSIIPGLAWEATFLVALPYKSGLGPIAWGFWTQSDLYSWIGPKHTNFHGGSICAFSPLDDTWSEGDDLRTLLDLYSVWALRHLHLQFLGRWPGKQYSAVGADPLVQAYYRRVECKDDELCGCGSETNRYRECCKPADMRLNVGQLMSHFVKQIEGGFSTRLPPPSIIEFIEGSSPLPQIANVHNRGAASFL